MYDEGWNWDVIPAIVDIKFPAFANIAQKALNVNNHVPQPTSELEMAVQLHEICEEPRFKNVDGWKDAAAQSMADQAIPSSAYARTILDFTLEYGSGQRAPEIRFMHDVASELRCIASLGEAFWAALT